MEKRIMRSQDNLEVTSAELDQYTIIQLLNEYNENMERIGGNTISKFSDRKSAIRRTWGSMLAAEITPLIGECRYIDESAPVVTIPEPAPAEPQVTCYICGKERPKNKTFDMMRDGKIAYFCKDTDCKPSSTKDKIAKATAQVKAEVTAKAEKRSAKVTKKNGERQNNIGKFDNCALVVLYNNRASATSVRSKIYTYISLNPSTTIPQIVEANVASIAVVRDCVKKLFADGKISITGWKVDVPRTFNFSQI